MSRQTNILIRMTSSWVVFTGMCLCLLYSEQLFVEPLWEVVPLVVAIAVLVGLRHRFPQFGDSLYLRLFSILFPVLTIVICVVIPLPLSIKILMAVLIPLLIVSDGYLLWQMRKPQADS